ncbi:MAG: DUF1292 domain-containing protein [Bacilli bacterium]|jgi:uncharacterized protein YrzB (UPF0473 family)|nr:DUF1292 domain-containing protein [Bacilli bacterium]
MKENKDNQMIITDESGVEHLCEILFTYENEKRKTSYVLFFEVDKPDEILAMRYKEDQTLEDIEDDEEFNEVVEVFNAFNEDEAKEN